jgi:hypothetical protein
LQSPKGVEKKEVRSDQQSFSSQHPGSQILRAFGKETLQVFLGLKFLVLPPVSKHREVAKSTRQSLSDTMLSLDIKIKVYIRIDHGCPDAEVRKV